MLAQTILMLSKCYESNEVVRRTWPLVPSWTHWSTTSDTHQVVALYKETFTNLKMDTPFKFEFNNKTLNNMDHMPISGTKPYTRKCSLTKQSTSLRS